MVGALLGVVLTACGGESFAERDPNGYEACSQWASASSKGDTTSLLGGMLGISEVARKSSTKAIRASVKNLMDKASADKVGQFGLVDTDKLEKACADEGFKIS